MLLAVPLMIPWLAIYAIWVALHPGQGLALSFRRAGREGRAQKFKRKKI